MTDYEERWDRAMTAGAIQNPRKPRTYDEASSILQDLEQEAIHDGEMAEAHAYKMFNQTTQINKQKALAGKSKS